MRQAYYTFICILIYIKLIKINLKLIFKFAYDIQVEKNKWEILYV